MFPSSGSDGSDVDVDISAYLLLRVRWFLGSFFDPERLSTFLSNIDKLLLVYRKSQLGGKCPSL